MHFMFKISLGITIIFGIPGDMFARVTPAGANNTFLTNINHVPK